MYGLCVMWAAYNCFLSWCKILLFPVRARFILFKSEREKELILSPRFGTIRNKKQSTAELTKKKTQIIREVYKKTHSTRYNVSAQFCLYSSLEISVKAKASFRISYPGFCATIQKKICFNYMRFPSCNDSILFCTKTDSLTMSTTF